MQNKVMSRKPSDQSLCSWTQHADYRCRCRGLASRLNPMFVLVSRHLGKDADC